MSAQTLGGFPSIFIEHLPDDALSQLSLEQFRAFNDYTASEGENPIGQFSSEQIHPFRLRF